MRAPNMYFHPSQPYTELGRQPKGQADYVEQGGVVFAWSESNTAYEAILERRTRRRLVSDVQFDRIIQRSGDIPSLGTAHPGRRAS